MKYKILIVEDQEDNRFYLKTILEAKECQVTEAENGKVALNLFQQASFDVVITDILMPEMDGLTLLRAIKDYSPETPVIIISGVYELEKIIEALRSGSCDYITKPYEEQDVYKSIDRVFRLLETEAIGKICSGYLIKENRQFVFKNNPDQINSMAQFLCRNLAILGLKTERQLLQISLIEALSNAVFHGNLEIASTMKENDNLDSFESYEKRAKSKMKESPYCDRKITINYSLDEEKICYMIGDEGPGFDYNNLPDPLEPDSFKKPSGRGLLMIRSFCDEISWNEAGNEITLVKYRGGKDSLQTKTG